MSSNRKIACVIISLTLVFILLLCYITNNDNILASVNNVSTFPLLLIDAGHGGEDGGAVAVDGTLEKDINLQIAKQVQTMCHLFGLDYIMIRSTEDDLADHSLQTVKKRKMSDINARMNIINSNPQSVYVGIHQNQYSDKKISGLQVFYSDNNEISQHIADAIQTKTSEILQPGNNRTVKPSGENIYILYHTQQPAVMVECGFLSNNEECQKLKDSTYGTQLSLCIVGGLIQYYNNERIA